MANKTLNTRQKQVFRTLQQTPPVGRGKQQEARDKKSRGGAPAPKPDKRPVKSAE